MYLSKYCRMRAGQDSDSDYDGDYTGYSELEIKRLKLEEEKEKNTSDWTDVKQEICCLLGREKERHRREAQRRDQVDAILCELKYKDRYAEFEAQQTAETLQRAYNDLQERKLEDENKLLKLRLLELEDEYRQLEEEHQLYEEDDQQEEEDDQLDEINPPSIVTTCFWNCNGKTCDDCNDYSGPEKDRYPHSCYQCGERLTDHEGYIQGSDIICNICAEKEEDKPCFRCKDPSTVQWHYSDRVCNACVKELQEEKEKELQEEREYELRCIEDAFEQLRCMFGEE